MPKVTFDSNIFIGRKRLPLPASFHMSVVVLQELVAGAADEAEVKALDRARKEYAKAGRLLVPTADDWWLSGSVINSLQRGLKSKHRGVTPRLGVLERYRVANDVLIARTARRSGVTVVTDNMKDFLLIQRFCSVQFISGADYFGGR